jgi:hypothetical protein
MGGQTLLVADTRIGLVLFGKFGARINSISSHPKTQELPVRVYMLAGRAATTDLDVLPLCSMGQSGIQRAVRAGTFLIFSVIDADNSRSGPDSWVWYMLLQTSGSRQFHLIQHHV